MGRGTLRGVFGAWLGLIALQAVSTSGGSGRVAEAFRDLDGILQRVLDPKVPAIPDRRAPVNNQTQPVFGAPGSGTWLGPAFGTPVTEAPSNGNPIGLPMIPGVPASAPNLPAYRYRHNY
jgi:hypothetical protein